MNRRTGQEHIPCDGGAQTDVQKWGLSFNDFLHIQLAIQDCKEHNGRTMTFDSIFG